MFCIIFDKKKLIESLLASPTGNFLLARLNFEICYIYHRVVIDKMCCGLLNKPIYFLLFS